MGAGCELDFAGGTEEGAGLGGAGEKSEVDVTGETDRQLLVRCSRARIRSLTSSRTNRRRTSLVTGGGVIIGIGNV